MSAQGLPRRRRFNVGDEFPAGGMVFRCVKGKKKMPPGEVDVRLDWWVSSGWEPVIIDALLAAFECIAENEDRRYPYPADGGEKTLKAFRLARKNGWQSEADKLQRERQAYQERIDAAWFNQDRDQGENEL